jgi:hypothetical protein
MKCLLLWNAQTCAVWNVQYYQMSKHVLHDIYIIIICSIMKCINVYHMKYVDILTYYMFTVMKCLNMYHMNCVDILTLNAWLSHALWITHACVILGLKKYFQITCTFE